MFLYVVLVLATHSVSSLICHHFVCQDFLVSNTLYVRMYLLWSTKSTIFGGKLWHFLIPKYVGLSILSIAHHIPYFYSTSVHTYNFQPSDTIDCFTACVLCVHLLSEGCCAECL